MESPSNSYDRNVVKLLVAIETRSYNQDGAFDSN